MEMAKATATPVTTTMLLARDAARLADFGPRAAWSRRPMHRWSAGRMTVFRGLQGRGRATLCVPPLPQPTSPSLLRCGAPSSSASMLLRPLHAPRADTQAPRTRSLRA